MLGSDFLYKSSSEAPRQKKTIKLHIDKIFLNKRAKAENKRPGGGEKVGRLLQLGNGSYLKRSVG